MFWFIVGIGIGYVFSKYVDVHWKGPPLDLEILGNISSSAKSEK